MPFGDTKILEFSQYQKFDKAQFDIYADLECLIEKIDISKNIPQNSLTIKVSEHIASGFPMYAMSSFKNIENGNALYRGKDCIKKFGWFLREHALKIINFKKNKMKLITNEQQESYENGKICYICKGKLKNKYLKDKKCCKVRDFCHYTGEYRGAAHRKCYLKNSVLKKTL